jgi:hypothetical protein
MAHELLMAVQLAIGKRFDAVCSPYTHSSIAAMLGVSRESVRRYRAGASALPCSVAARACQRLNVSPLWLLLGQGPRHTTPETTGPTAQAGGAPVGQP